MFRSRAFVDAVKCFAGLSESVQMQQARNTYVLKRRHPALLVKRGARPRKFTNKYLIYDLIEDVNMRPRPKLTVILAQDVPGIGERGELIEFKQLYAYKKYILTGMGVYNSPQNYEKYQCALKIKTRSEFLTPTVHRTKQELSFKIIYIVMSAKNPWILEPWHVSSAFYEMQIYVPEDAIELPSTEIKGPDMDLHKKEFYVTVTVNKGEKVNVRCRILHVGTSEKVSLPLNPEDIFLDPLFSDQADTLKKMPMKSY